MSVVSRVKQSPLVHLWLCSIFVISAVIVVTLQVCTLVLWPFSKKWYRNVTGVLIRLFWYQYVWLADYWSGSKLFVYCKEEELRFVGKEHMLFVLNHRYDVDWVMVWQIAARFNILPGGKAVMKDDLKYIPIMGWSFYLAEQVFVKRNFAEDKTSLFKQLENLTTYHVPISIVLFCEGTRYTKEKYEQSQAFAKKKGIPGLRHMLLPRTKGFTLCAQALKGKVPSIFDGTIAYDVESAPSLYDILCGKRCDCHLYVRRLPLDETPTDTEEETSEFLHEMYRGKDDAYEYFIKHKTFTGYDPSRNIHEFPRTRLTLYIMVGWMVMVSLPMLYFTYSVIIAGSLWTVLIVVISLYGIGHFAIATMTVSSSTYGLKEEKQK